MLVVIVCSCLAVNDATVRAALADGATTVADVTLRCEAASRCKGCFPALERFVAEHVGRQTGVTEAAAA